MSSQRTGDWDQASLERVPLPWVAQVRYLKETESTNRIALEWAWQGAPEGSLVVTDHQTKGKGRLGRGWFDPPGSCLLFSLVLRPQLRPQDLPLIGLGAGVALCEAVSRLGMQPRLKWPNDVMIGPSKVAGILAEWLPSAVILGVGVNVNVERFPPDIGSLATSLAIEAGRSFDRLELLEAFLVNFRTVYSSAPEGLVDAYRPWCSTLGQWVVAELPGRTVRGRAVDIDGSGGLVLEDGEVLRAGDVVHLKRMVNDQEGEAPIRMERP
ncbi:MAG TPA: biotin--[acetyl-CoA-carboxylase] ligase [Actinomycetota bacterium]|nr:biotin--[acetyl-CoA-carboxylase] ligase [Actinomycetota bacterium]